MVDVDNINQNYYIALHLEKITDAVDEYILKFILKGFFMSLGQSCI